MLEKILMNEIEVIKNKEMREYFLGLFDEAMKLNEKDDMEIAMIDLSELVAQQINAEKYIGLTAKRDAELEVVMTALVGNIQKIFTE